MTLWQFGDDQGGLLVVCAETAADACVKRDKWVAEQERKQTAYREWWAQAQNPTAGYWDRVRGLSERAIIDLGPIPEGGDVYYGVAGPPIELGETFSYMWVE